MTYNHERAKVLCPEAAREVERLREVLSGKIPSSATEYDGYAPPEDGNAGEYYVDGWNDCRDEMINLLGRDAN